MVEDVILFLLWVVVVVENELPRSIREQVVLKDFVSLDGMPMCISSVCNIRVSYLFILVRRFPLIGFIL